MTLCLGLVPLSSQAQTATIATLHSLTSNPDGARPYANLVQGTDGSFYGTTATGGVNGVGTIFKVTAAGEYTVLYAFQGDLGGSGTYSPLYLASDGNFYGTASGGSNGDGLIFRITPSGNFSSLYSFTGGTDGQAPYGGVIEGTDGNFYGTTAYGGLGYGTIYSITPQGSLTTLHSFTGLDGDGGAPYAPLLEGSDGSLYGTGNNSDGPAWYGIGNVFKITKSGVYSNIYTFTGRHDGGNPDGGLVEGPDGSFYGSTHNYGLFRDDDDDTGQGSLYKVAPDGTFTTLYDFTGNDDSGRPEGTLFIGSDGNLYGTTTNSPQSKLFQVTPDGKLTPMAQIGFYSDALCGPIVGSDAKLYGTTASGGSTSDGLVYQADVSPALTAPVQLALANSTVQLGNSVDLSWKALNVYSNTLQRCVAAVQNGLTGGGTWSGVQTGTLNGATYSGTTTLTPTASGTYTYTLTCGGTITGFATLTVPAMVVTSSSLPDGHVGTSYSATVAQANGLSPFVWSVASGSLPAGLTLDATTGALTGTPSQSGIYSFTVQVRDSESAPAVASMPLTITVATAQPSLSASSTTLTIAHAGATASTTLTLSGFASSAFNISCAGLPAKAQCVVGSVTGSQAYATATLQITTDGSLQSSTMKGAGSSGLALALLPGLMALFGFARLRRRSGLVQLACFVLLLVSACSALSGCGDSHKTTNATPAGSSTVTVTATAGDQSATTTLTVTVQ